MWISSLGQSVLLERPNDYDQTEYLRVDVPWPITDARLSLSAKDRANPTLRARWATEG